MSRSQEESMAEILAFLRKHDSAVVSTVSLKGDLESATVFFTVADDLKVYFMSKKETRKAKNILENNKISLVVTDKEGFTTVQMNGTAQKVHDPKVATEMINQLVETMAEIKGRWLSPLLKLTAGFASLFEITPTWVKYSDFGGVIARVEEINLQKDVDSV